MQADNRPGTCGTIIFAGIIFLLIFAPLAFGAVHVWAYTIVEITVFSLLLLWFLDRLVFSRSESLEWVNTPVNLGLILILVLVILQVTPLPASLVATISPRTYADKMNLFQIMAAAGHPAAGRDSWISLAHYTHPAVREGLKLAAYAGMFFLVINSAKSRRRINTLIIVLIMMGLFEAVYAVYQTFSDTPRVWWWKSRVGRQQWASGTFIVSNHFAAYMEMVIPLCFGFFMAQKKQTIRLLSGLGGTRAAIQRAVSWFSPESIRPRMFLFFFFAIIMGVSLLFSASRGGILSMGVAMFLVSALFFSKHRFRTYGVLAMGLCLIVIVYGLRLGIDPTIDKFTKRKGGLTDRLYVTRTILPMITDYSATGVGWGNFRYLYPRYITDYDRVSSSGHAHNDWVEAGIETGLAGGILILAAFSGYMVSMIRTWRRRRDIYAVGIGAGVMTGILSIAVHSFFEFNMHVPANPLTLAALAGTGYAVVHRQKRGYIASFFYRVRRVPLTRLRRVAMACGVLLLFSLSVSAAGRHFIAESHCPVEWNSTMNLNWDPEPEDIQTAIAQNPGNAEYHFKRFGVLNRINAPGSLLSGSETRAIPSLSNLPESMFRQAKNEQLIKSLEKAVRLNPVRGIYWYELGQRYAFRSYDPFGYLNRWLPLAEACYDMAIACAPKDDNMLFNVAWYWVWRSSLLPEQMNPESSQAVSQPEPNLKGVPYRQDAIQQFQELFQRSLSLNPQQWKKAANRVWEYYPDDSIILGIVPPGNTALKQGLMMFLAEK